MDSLKVLDPEGPIREADVAILDLKWMSPLADAASLLIASYCIAANLRFYELFEEPL
jgi:hypothetical protein